jgi:hypothetical protein
MIVLGAQAQGYFNFVTRADAAHQIKFTDAAGVPLSGSDYFVQVFAGSVANNLVPLTGLGNEPLALNRTGSGAGLTNPFSKVYTTALPGGTAYVGYAAFQGTDWASATRKAAIITTVDGYAGTTPLTVTLAVAPNLPNDLVLGNNTVPEPATLALSLLGLASLLVIRCWQASWFTP